MTAEYRPIYHSCNTDLLLTRKAQGQIDFKPLPYMHMQKHTRWAYGGMWWTCLCWRFNTTVSYVHTYCLRRQHLSELWCHFLCNKLALSWSHTHTHKLTEWRVVKREEGGVAGELWKCVETSGNRVPHRSASGHVHSDSVMNDLQEQHVHLHCAACALLQVYG